MQRPVPPDQSEPGAVLSYGNHVRRQRPDHVRAAGFARPRADPHRLRDSPKARSAGRPPTRLRSARCRRTSTPSMRRIRTAIRRFPPTLRGRPGRREHPVLPATRQRPYDAHPVHGQQCRRLPAAQQHAAVSGVELHHRPAGRLPVTELTRAASCPVLMLARFACSAAAFRRPDGRSATASSCRSRRTRSCSSWSAPSTAATGKRRSVSRICRAAFRSIWARRAVSLTRSARRQGPRPNPHR